MSIISPGGIALVDGQKGVVSTLPDHFWPDNDRPLVKVTSKYNMPLVATADTRIETTTGWKCIRDLRVGDTFRVCPSAHFGSDTHIPSFNYQWSRNMGRILGLLTVRGREFYPHNAVSPYVVGFNKEDTPLAEQFATWFQDCLEMSAHTAPYVYGKSERVHLIVEQTHRMNSFFAHCVRDKINPWLWTAPRDAVLGFFEGILCGNGTIEAPKGEMYIISTCETFAQELVSLALYSLQVRMRIRMTPSERQPDRIRYRIKLEQDNIPLFLAQIQLLRHEMLKKLGEVKPGRRFYKDEYLDTIASIEPAPLGPAYQLVTSSPTYVNGYRIQ